MTINLFINGVAILNSDALWSVNSKLDWNDNLVAIFDVKLTLFQVLSPIVFVGGVEAIFLVMYTEI